MENNTDNAIMFAGNRLLVVDEPPGGTVMFLFTDIEGSTRLWERYPVAMRGALARHDDILRQAIEEQGGYVFKTIGDAFCAAFADPAAALRAVLTAQESLVNEAWGETEPIKVRAALHSGPAEWQHGEYFAPATLNRLNRVLSTAHGGQVVLSRIAQQLVRGHLPDGVTLRDMGDRRLRDLTGSERIYQLCAPSLPDDFPPLRTLDERPNNLPAQPTSFVGREAELASALAILCQPGVRLLTLSGPGGTGKTRLSLQVAAEAFDDFEHGLYFVPLGTVSDPALVGPTIAQALGLKEGSGSLADSLKDYLRDKSVLLVLDNFEQVVDAATLIGDLLTAAPRLKVLVTSREGLRLYGEYDYPVPPLPLPDLANLPPLSELAANPTVALFVSRAQAARSNFALTADNAAAVAEICARLDGLPLAIELAAARVKLFSPPQLLRRLDNRLGMLTGGASNLPGRQQSLRGAIDWSYDLLSEEERALFARLSVFAGGWNMAAAEAVCADVAGGARVDVFSGIISLLDKSLIRPLTSPSLSTVEARGDVDEPRFAMLGTIREYAAEKLAGSSEEVALHRQHAECYVQLAEVAEAQFNGSELVGWLNRLEAEHDNIRSALRWLLTAGDNDRALQLGGAIWRFWNTRAYLTEGQGWLEAVLALDAAPSAARSKVLNGIGVVAMQRGQYAEARNFHEQSLQINRQLADVKAISRSLNNLGVLARMEGDYEDALTYHEESLTIKRQLGDRQGIANSLNNLGVVHRDLHEYATAKRLFEESIEIEREVGNQWGIADSLNNIGLVAVDEGNYVLARDCYRRSLAIQLQLGEKEGVAYSLEGMAGIAALQGDARRAAMLYGAAEALREEINAPVPPSDYADYVRKIAAVRSGPVDADFGAAWMAGRQLNLDAAVAYALEQPA